MLVITFDEGICVARDVQDQAPVAMQARDAAAE